MDALLLAVLNALWQGAALIALVALALRAGLRRNATTACVVWSITFAVVALLPAIDYAVARPAAAHATPAAAVPAVVATTVVRTTVEPARYANSRTASVVVSQSRAVASERAASEPLGATSRMLNEATMLVGGNASAFFRAWGYLVAGAWALIAGGLLFRLALAYAAVARMKRAAYPLDDPVILARLRAAGHRRRAAVMCSARVEIPCAVGFRHPMILVPERLASSLDAEDLARIVLHESAHLQRYDDWVNALEQVVCALQFFQPALYVARRSIDFEREVACDDRVLEDSGEPLRYAECLARIVQRHVRGRQAAVVPGFVLRRTQVVARVRRIVDRSRDASPHLRIAAAVLGGAVMIATLGIARLQVPLVAPAAAEPPPAPAAPPVPAATRTFVISAPAVDAPSAVASAAPVAPVAPLHPAAAPKRAAKAVAPPHRAAPRAPSAAVAPVAPVAPVVPVAAPEPVRERTTQRLSPLVRTVTVEVPTRLAPLPALNVEQLRTRFLAGELVSIAPPAVRIALPIVRADVKYLAEAPEAPRAPLAPIVVRRDGGDILDAIDEAKYPHPSVDELIALRNQGVSAEYIRGMGALGRARPPLNQLIALASQGVTPSYVGALDRLLATTPTFSEVIALRSQGVSASWLEGLAAAGYPKLSASDAVSLRVQGVDGAFVQHLAARGYHNLSVSELLRLRVSGF